MAKYTQVKLLTGDTFDLEGEIVHAVELLGPSHATVSGMIPVTTMDDERIYVNPAAIAIAREMDPEGQAYVR